MPTEFTETTPEGTVSGTKSVEVQSEGTVVEYDLQWGGEERVTVTLSDRLPTADVAEVGFHDDHEPPEWRIEDETLQLETDLDGGDRRTFVLGLVVTGDSIPTGRPCVPSVDVVDTRRTGGEATGLSDRTRASVRNGDERDEVGVVESDEDAVAEHDEDAVAEHDEDAIAESDREIPADAGATVDEETAAAVSGTSPDSGDGRVLGALLDELESGVASDAELATLREHLDDQRSASESVRLEYVQKRLADFDAYVDALEDLLAVRGSGADALEELDGRLTDLAADVDALRRQQDELADRVGDLSTAIEANTEAIDVLEAEHREDVEAFRTELDRHREATDERFDDLRGSLGTDLAALEAELESFESIRRALVDDLQRPDDEDPDTSSDDAAPAANVETESASTVDPSTVATSRALRDRLEAAEATNFTGDDARSSDFEGDDARISEVTANGRERPEDGTGPVRDGPEGASANARVDVDGGEPRDGATGDVPVGIDLADGDGTDDAAGEAALDASSEGSGDGGSGDREPADANGSPAPGTDEDATDGAVTFEEATDGDATGRDETAGAETDADETVVDAANDRSPGGQAPDDDPASSIFEIGDVESDDPVDEELPTIDFEDS